jgi:methionyl aminopeptidase
MIHLKTPTEIDIMRRGGKILRRVLLTLLTRAKLGVSLLDLDKLAESMILSAGAEPSFKHVKGYKWTICVCVNDVVVHGIPTGYCLKTGDKLGIDCGVYYDGFHTDAAWTIKIKNEKLKNKNENNEVDRFLAVGEKALSSAIKQVKVGNYIYDISKAIQENVEKNGYSTVKNLVGHGIGRNLHEAPEVPCFVKNNREETAKISSGMALAIEVIYNMGEDKVKYKGSDGWTITTKDGKISGLFEATVVAIPHGCLILT